MGGISAPNSILNQRLSFVPISSAALDDQVVEQTTSHAVTVALIEVFNKLCGDSEDQGADIKVLLNKEDILSAPGRGYPNAPPLEADKPHSRNFLQQFDPPPPPEVSRFSLTPPAEGQRVDSGPSFVMPHAGASLVAVALSV